MFTAEYSTAHIGTELLRYSLLVAGLVFLFMAVMAARKRQVRAAKSYAVLMMAASIYAIGYFLELQSATVEEAFMWIRLAYLGMALLPALWVLFVIQYTDRPVWLALAVVAAMFVISFITLIMVMTNEFHHLYYRSIGSLFPWVTIMVYQFQMSPQKLDLGAFGMIAAGIIYLYDLYRYQLFDFLPIARARVFGAIGDGVVVLDLHNRDVDTNKAPLQLHEA